MKSLSSLLLPGWLYKVRLEDEKELENLMSEDVYHEYLKSQAHDW